MQRLSAPGRQLNVRLVYHKVDRKGVMKKTSSSLLYPAEAQEIMRVASQYLNGSYVAVTNVSGVVTNTVDLERALREAVERGMDEVTVVLAPMPKQA